MSTNGFLGFIPLQYQTGTTQLTENPATPIDDLKMISIARLMLDNIDHIKSYWVTIGEETASIGLNFGAFRNVLQNCFDYLYCNIRLYRCSVSHRSSWYYGE